jgi:hypothetical protein
MNNKNTKTSLIFTLFIYTKRCCLLLILKIINKIDKFNKKLILILKMQNLTKIILK